MILFLNNGQNFNDKMKSKNYHPKIPGTMCDFENYYYQVAQDLPKKCRICEVGVGDGKSSILLAESITNLGKEIDRFVIIDNCAYGGQEQRNTIISNLLKSGMGEKVEFWEMDSLNASLKFPGEYFDFVFLDSGHTYELTKAEILLWNSRIKHDGILAGHDYNSKENPGVRLAVDEVVPKNVLQVEGTEKGLGVWHYIVNVGVTLKYK